MQFEETPASYKRGGFVGNKIASIEDRSQARQRIETTSRMQPLGMQNEVAIPVELIPESGNGGALAYEE